MDTLMGRAYDFVGKSMQQFTVLYRCKPKIYWDDIHYNTDKIMVPYQKDDNGQPASPINGRISG
jgi:hypothetical protein